MDRPANDLSGTRLPVVMARTWSGRLTSSRRIGRRTWRPVKGLTSWRMTAGRLTGIAGLCASAPRALVWTGSIDRWCNHRRDVSRRIRRRQVSRRRRRRARPAGAIALGRRRQRPIGTGHDLEAAVARLLVGNNHGRQPVDHAVGVTNPGCPKPNSPSITAHNTSTPFSNTGTSGLPGMAGPSCASAGEALTAMSKAA